MKSKILLLFCTLLVLCSGILGAFLVIQRTPTRSRAAGNAAWPMFQGDLGHSGYNGAETILNSNTAPQLKLQWAHQASGPISSQVVEANGLLYWGSYDGLEHATNPADGTDAWATNVGTTSSCNPPIAGPAGAAAVASVPINGTATSVAFVAGGDSALYALNALTGAQIWRTPLGTPPNHMTWAGPVLYNGNLYVGVASYGDCPLIPGQLFEVNASTGSIVNFYDVVPPGCIGGGIWDTPTIDQATGMLYVSTGTYANSCTQSGNQAEGLLELRSSDLSLVGWWQVPPSERIVDSDFGSTPTLFQATIGGTAHQMVGLVNKNGLYYAFDRSNISAGPLWQVRLSDVGGGNSFASSGWDGARLYAADAGTTVNGTICRGSLRALDPASGAFLWQDCLSEPVQSSIMAVPGLVAIGEGANVIVVDAATGTQLFAFHDPGSGHGAGARFVSTSTIVNGVLYQGSYDGDLFALGVPGTSTPSPSPSPTVSPTITPTTTSTATSTTTPIVTPSPTPSLQPGPVFKTWYFAEGRVGGGFTEYLSLDNPTSNACAVGITYLYTPDRGTPLTRTVGLTIPANSRYEEGVDGDLGTYATGPGVTDSAMVAVNTNTTPNCTGIVAERPMYYNTQGNSLGANSSSDVLGVTHLGTSFYLADVATGPQDGGKFSSFITILNPPAGQLATVTAKYYANSATAGAPGTLVGTDQVKVAGGTRGTIFPNNHSPALPAHVSVVVTSDQAVAVERPVYVSTVSEGNAGTVSGGADVIGVQSLSKDWLFAEGYTGGQFQENFVIANLDPANVAATVTIKLELPTGPITEPALTIQPHSQVIWNVNTAAPGQNVSAEITSVGANIVAEREMFFHYNHVGNGRSMLAMGGTDVLGQIGPSAQTLYSFAEGYVNTSYDEWLTLQNPTATAEIVWVTLYNALGRTFTFYINVNPNSRATVDIVQVVFFGLYRNGDGYKGLEVAMTVQTTSNTGGPFVAERPMYSNVSGIQGGTDIIGYIGG